MLHFTWQEVLTISSFFACIAGILLALSGSSTQDTEVEDTNRMLFLMSFTYWMVYCVAEGLQKLIAADWEVLVLSLKLTAIICYFLTFACILSLPLHHIASRQKVEQ